MKIFQYFLSVCFIILFFGCDDAFSPKGDFGLQYGLHSVIDVDEQSITVELFSSYDVEGYNPKASEYQPLVEDAVVYVEYKNTKYYLLDSLDTEQNKTLFYTDAVTFSKYDTLWIHATIADEATLSAYAILPMKIDANYSFPEISTTPTNSPYSEGLYGWGVGWIAKPIYFYTAKLTLHYQEVYATETVDKYIEIPRDIMSSDNSVVPLYPDISKINRMFFRFDAIKWAMTKISENRANGVQKYLIGKAKLEILTLEEHLGKYYSSINAYFDQYSVRLDETTYTNVSDGLGVFGAFAKYEKVIRVEDKLIYDYGYEMLGK